VAHPDGDHCSTAFSKECVECVYEQLSLLTALLECIEYTDAQALEGQSDDNVIVNVRLSPQRAKLTQGPLHTLNRMVDKMVNHLVSC